MVGVPALRVAGIVYVLFGPKKSGARPMNQKKKSQHFVPRHYLKRFSFDQGKQIRILTISRGEYVSKGGLKGQCAKPYFYHTDPGVEDALTDLEGRAEELFKKITTEHWLPTDAPTVRDILTVLNVMRCRTEMFADQTAKLAETSALEGFRMQLEANNKQELLKFLPALRFGFTNWPMKRVIKGLTMSMLLGDLHLKLLIPPRGAHFMTSDHPVVLLNQAFVNVGSQ